MALTDTAIRKAKPADTPQKLRDGGGLYLLLRPDGARWWRMDYRRPVTGKRNTLSLGTYPLVSLAEVRQKHQEAKKLLAAGVDPGVQRKAERTVAVDRAANSFAVVGEELLIQRAKRIAEGTAARERRLFDNDLSPYVGGRPVDAVMAPELLEALRRIERRGALETAHRARVLASQIFRYAIATGRAERNPAADLIGALVQPVGKNFASVTEPDKVAPMLQAMHGYFGTPVVMAALKLAPLVFVRPGELRRARWADIDVDAGEWRYLVTKTQTEHIVPLATQAVEILRELQPLTGAGEYVFPGIRDRRRPMSENTINAALRRLGYDSSTMTGHGFRAMARTILDEVLGFRPDYIEHQLAHAVRDPNGRAYNRTAHLAERKKMMQVWADYLDGLRTGANVVPLQRKVG